MLELDSVYKVSGWDEKLGNYRLFGHLIFK
jgi:hypothetical protein